MVQEASPLLHGAYNGPVLRKRRAQDNEGLIARVTQWLRDVILPPIVFISFAICTATHHGPGKLLSVTVGVLEALIIARTIMEIFRGKWKNVAAGVMFAAVAGIASIYNNVGLVVASVFCLFCAGMAINTAKKGRGSMTALYFALFIATASGAVFGMYVQMNQFSPFNAFQSLATYMNLDPSRDKGGAYRDAGSVYFKEGTHIDVKRAIAVKSKDIFCLAPLIRVERAPLPGDPMFPPPDSGTIDWWIVGMNCCDPSGEQFKCGQTGVATARSGLRLLRDDLRHFYSMGVSEWTSKYGLPAKHPLFFEWVTDPLGDVTALKVEGWAQLLRGSEMFAGLNILVAFVGLSISSVVALAHDKAEE